MLKVAETVVPDKRAAFALVSLSRNTVVQRVVDLATDLTTQLEEKAWEFSGLLFANDESTDVTDTAALSLYILVRGVNPDFWSQKSYYVCHVYMIPQKVPTCLVRSRHA